MKKTFPGFKRAEDITFKKNSIKEYRFTRPNLAESKDLRIYPSKSSGVKRIYNYPSKYRPG